MCCTYTENGRNFEYLSGEDPYLGYVLVQPVVKAIQGQQVVAMKHYVNNNQETNRHFVSENVDDALALKCIIRHLLELLNLVLVSNVQLQQNQPSVVMRK